ncbi:hypothetical protein ACE1CB_38020 [Aerosakkonema sp. BLCC-F2]
MWSGCGSDGLRSDRFLQLPVGELEWCNSQNFQADLRGISSSSTTLGAAIAVSCPIAYPIHKVNCKYI